MGLMNIFSKKNDKKSSETPEQNIEDYYTPVVEPVGELPVGELPVGDSSGKFVSEPLESINTSVPEIKFEDDKPLQILTSEQKELVDNGYYLTPSYLNETNQVNPTTNLLQSVQPTNDYDNDSYVDDELPYNNDEEDVFNSNVDGTYSSVGNNTYEDDRVNEHKFFSTSVDDIDNYKQGLGQNNQEKTKILGSASIFNINRIDDNNNKSA